MADFVFPSSDLDRPRQLLALLGSFWAGTYEGQDQVLSFSGSRGRIAQQTERDLLELIASVGRMDIQVFHKDNWYLHKILKSERNDAQTSLLKYDDPDVTAVYDSSFQYDVPRNRILSAYPLPSNLKQVFLVMNRITSPSASLTHGVDFILDETSNALIFREDPFDNPKFARRIIFEDGAANDEELALWLFMGDFDLERVFEQFAYVIGLRLESSESYRDLMNAIFDALVGGTARAQLSLAVQAMTGIPLVQDAQETVELVDRDTMNIVVVTDKNTYKYPLSANVIVAVGDELEAGDPITDGLQIIELNDGVTPSDLAAVTLGRGILATGYFGDLSFENEDVTLVVDSDHPSGFTFVSFRLGGFELDVEKFFDDLHNNGVMAGQTLAMLLDERTNKVGQPTAFNLPETINPLEFLIENVLRNNTFIVKVAAGQVAETGAGLDSLRHLRRIIPPHTAMISIIELTMNKESVTLDNVDDTALSLFFAMEPLTESVGPASVKETGLTFRKVSESCQ